MNPIRQTVLAPVRRVLIKVGSAVLTGADGLDLTIVQQLVDDIALLTKSGRQVVLVTSGAIASGKHRMGITGELKSMPQKQAAAAIGQGRLMRVYSNAFGRHGLYVAQLLLTLSDLTDRKRFLNIRNTLSTLMEWGVIAVINENDSVAVDEIKFGDNDHLAAMIANIIEAHLLVNLTSTEGLYDRNPGASREARLIPLVREFTEDILEAATAETSDVGTGGMRSKILAAQKVTAFGIPYIIAPGKRPGVLGALFAAEAVGTLFLPMQKHLTSRKHWIAFTLRGKGKLVIDDGAKWALLEQGKSLLPSGVVDVEGDFGIGDPVVCVDACGAPVAKGLVNYAADEIRKIMGLKTARIAQVLGHKDYDEIIHRDNLAIRK
ncbi:MAG: glutamate 5-kinase [Syntrophales bacterium]|jgi:glutamate 5-kinase|nr:glutamate 5-kinase [Syntrophales bacterium]MDD4338218.1 glutamate 5-kinase [Syntrophales bacterium]HOG07797.1 glutamate 5-kinase [Syntrophales bacterium]HPB70305.1 glutamate 5-kinase [Syntrophales bacterium]HQN25552.1 glutamate 5-kinase [Syntrophales bacterium]